MGNPNSDVAIEFDVHWNTSLLNVPRRYDGDTYLTTEEDITALVCNLDTTTSAEIPTEYEFTNLYPANNLDGIVGIGIDNGVLDTSLIDDNGTIKDSLYNVRSGATSDSSYTTDLCMHTVYNNWVIYRSFAVCMKTSDYTSVTKSPEMCSDEVSCY